VLRGTIFNHRNQLHFSPNPRAEDDRQLEGADAGKIPVRVESATEDYPLVEAQGLFRHVGIFLQSGERTRGATWSRAVPTSANFQKGCRCSELVSSRISGHARRV